MTGEDAMAKRPNVLFIITDQHRADHVGFGGNGVVRTPNLDAIAERGTVFANAWVANPVCMPNRSTLVTGRMPTAHGVVFNDRSHEWGANTHVPVLDDPAASVRNHVLIEDDIPSAVKSPLPNKTRTLVSGDGMKYTRHSTGEDQLFDLVADPDETTHLGVRDPERRARAVDQLADALMAADDDARGTPSSARPPDSARRHED